MERPLTGVTVLDFSNLLPGPYCSMLLSDLGAEVVKVERPPYGDYVRQLSPKMFSQLNRNKKSITIDFKNEEDIHFVHSYIKHCDVVIEGFRPGTMEKHGLGYKELSILNSRLLYCSISGYGQSGKFASFPGHDINYLATSGALSISGAPDGPPEAHGGIQVADLAASLYAANSILAALLQREKTQRGEYIDLSITDSIFAMMGPRISEYYDRNAPTKNAFMGRGAYGVFRTKDDQYLAVGCMEDHFFKRLCESVNRLDLSELADYGTWHLRSVNYKKLNENIGKEILSKDLQDWVKIFAEYDLPCNKVNSIEDLKKEEHFIERDIMSFDPESDDYIIEYPANFSNDFRAKKFARAPKVGEHNNELKK